MNVEGRGVFWWLTKHQESGDASCARLPPPSLPPCLTLIICPHMFRNDSDQITAVHWDHFKPLPHPGPGHPRHNDPHWPCHEVTRHTWHYCDPSVTLVWRPQVCPYHESWVMRAAEPRTSGQRYPECSSRWLPSRNHQDDSCSHQAQGV